MEKQGSFYLGKLFNPQTGKVKDDPLFYSSKDLTTHAVCVGMTGSGKTGLGISLLEEAGLDHIPSIIIDPKGDMGNILLTFPHLSAEEFKPWIDRGEAERKGQSLDTYAEEVAKTWREGLEAWQEKPERIQELRNAVTMEIYTPASRAGIPISILSSFEAPTKEFALDVDAMRERVLSTTSSLLGLLGIDANPIKSREHILLSTIISQTWKEGKDLDLASLIQQVQTPPFEKIGVLDIDTFFPPKDRKNLSINLNNLLAAPGFQAWMDGAPLNIQQLLYTSDQRPKISVISIAHLSDPERMFFVTLFLNQLIAWMRKQTGTSSLRAIFYMDEIFGYFPSTAAPPSKMPMITLLKQARAFGLGIVLCTQNPVDLDYKGLSNCGTWFIGRLQTARDKMRVMEGLIAASNGEIDSKAMDKLMSGMSNRVFILRSIYQKEPLLFQTRWALSYLRGPLTLSQIEILTKNDQKDFNTHLKKSEKSQNVKPTIPSTLNQYYLFNSQNTSTDYLPFVVGFSKLHFIDKKYNVDAWQNSCLVTGVVPGSGLSWDESESHPDLRKQLSQSPVENATYQDVPAELLQEKKYPSFKQDLLTYLYQNITLTIFEFKGLKLLSTLQESEQDFRQRILENLKVQHDDQLKKLRESYDKKIAFLNEKIRRAEEKKSTQQQQSLYQKFEAFLSIFTTILGAFFGKKFSKTTITQTGTSFKRIGRIGKENQDVTIAEENLQTLQQQLEQTHAELNDEITKISVLPSVDTLQIDEVLIRPRKTDIVIEEVALVWWL